MPLWLTLIIAGIVLAVVHVPFAGVLVVVGVVLFVIGLIRGSVR